MARRYIVVHRQFRRHPLHALGVAARWFATGLVLALGLMLAEQAYAGLTGAAISVGDQIEHLIPEPVIDNGTRPTPEPVAPNAAPVLDAIDKVTNNARLVVSGRLQSFTLGGPTAPKVEIALNAALVASPALDQDGKFSATVNLASGTNTIVVTMVRGTERVAALPRSIVLDTTPPQLTVSKPVDGATVDAGSLTVSGSAEAGATVTVNGHSAVVSADGTFTDFVQVTAGPVTVDVVARDQAGNETKKTLHLSAQQTGDVTGIAVTVSLDHASVKAGTFVTADIYVTSYGVSVPNASVVVDVGLAQIAAGRTDGGGHYRVSFGAPSTEGFVQVIALVNGTGRGSTSLEITK